MLWNMASLIIHTGTFFFILHMQSLRIFTPGDPIASRLNPYVTVAAGTWRSNPGYCA